MALVSVMATALSGDGGERRAQNGPSYYGDKHTTAGWWLDKRNDNAGGRNLHPFCWYRSQAVKGCAEGRVNSIAAAMRHSAWLNRCRILSNEYERTTESSESNIYPASIRLMLRRLASSPT